jgi:hypothetical protein
MTIVELQCLQIGILKLFRRRSSLMMSPLWNLFRISSSTAAGFGNLSPESMYCIYAICNTAG